jgi:putative flippase GtrA
MLSEMTATALRTTEMTTTGLEPPVGTGAIPSGRGRARTLVRRLVRYAAVSAISTSVSLTVLGILVGTGAVTAGWANVIATAVGTVPSFELNRRWVWARSGKRSLLAEIGPFCALSFAGLALSTVAVSLAAGWASSAGLGTAWRTIAAETASLGTFGTLWVAQYLILDRLLFRVQPAS